MKLTRRQRLAWAKAVFRAGWYGINGMPLKKLLAAGMSVWRAMRARPGDEVSEEVYQTRLECCNSCPLFRPEYETCGPVVEDGAELGCRCYVPVLAKLKLGHCWLRQNAPGLGMGWDLEKTQESNTSSKASH